MTDLELRNAIEELIAKDMLGPGSERFCGFDSNEEVITAYDPDDRYSVGLLYPRMSHNEQTNETVVAAEDANAADDVDQQDGGGTEVESAPNSTDEVSSTTAQIDVDDVGVMTTTFKPSAMGISFVVKEADAEKVFVSASAGFYIKREALKKSKVIGCDTDDGVAHVACRVVVPSFDCDEFQTYFKEDPIAILQNWGITLAHDQIGWVMTFNYAPKDVDDVGNRRGLDKWEFHDALWDKLDDLGAKFSLNYKTAIDAYVDEKRSNWRGPNSNKGQSIYALCIRRIHLEPLGVSEESPFSISEDKDHRAFHLASNLYAAIERLYSQWDHGMKRFHLVWNGKLADIEPGKLYPLTCDKLLTEQSVMLSCEKHDYGSQGEKLYFLSIFNAATDAYDPVYAQPHIALSCDDPVFFPLRRLECNVADPEDRILEMQYRNKRYFCRGCGCSGEWFDVEDGCAKRVQSTFLPRKAIKQIDQSVKAHQKALDMGFLSSEHGEAGEEPAKKFNELTGFVNDYGFWINGLRENLDKEELLKTVYEKESTSVIEACECSRKRMLQGIAFLKEDTIAYRAFCLANKSIYVAKQQEATIKGKSPIETWRPFQLGFILLTIESIAREKSEDRATTDLLWFPTGGGKTEAYLCLTAFAIFYRYLKNENPAGTTVIMRYTLRLLATQQFQRACSLICACEKIRRESVDLSNKPEITIGLWIGGKAMPNKIADVKPLVKTAHENGSSPFEPIYCPWCGHKLEYDIKEDQLVALCGNKECYFRSGGLRRRPLPIKIVDEMLYDNPPTLLFGTVDKFAQLSFNENSGSLFGLRNGDRKMLPPSLIIQDELHLITEQLGSLVGMYESVVDGLCMFENGGMPKVIASTATARRAIEQCKALYAAKRVCQFPPPGLNVEDSYFYREKSADGREYIGIQSLSMTPADTLIRLMAALLLRIGHLSLWGVDKNQADKYYTLVGYFNSLRELGSCQSWVKSKIQERINELCNYEIIGRRWLDEPQIMCSRRSQNEISMILDRMGDKLGGERKPIDVLLASNMLSVGLDVDRLGIMVMAGQPKKNAEFIQASSRVGRAIPESGLVVSFFNGKRARDRSYFEVFPDFVQSFYRYVEPATVTPYTFAVRERMLRQVVVTLMRHLVRGLQDQPSGGGVAREQILNQIQEFLIRRVETECRDVVRDELKVICEKINNQFSNNVFTCYKEPFHKVPENSVPVFLDPLDERLQMDVECKSGPAMNSLRNVDTAVPVVLV